MPGNSHEMWVSKACGIDNTTHSDLAAEDGDNGRCCEAADDRLRDVVDDETCRRKRTHTSRLPF